MSFHKIRGSLPEQMSEAVADYYGTTLAVKFIKQAYPDDPIKQRNAALAIFFSLPPMLYKGKAANLMNEAGSKKTNEQRVLKLILANKEFRQLLACNLASEPKPIECLVPN